jgi:MFS family permease
MPLIDYIFLGKIKPKRRLVKSYEKAKKWHLNRIRLAMSFFYFGMGFCFASWASRIPSIKTVLDLSDGELGVILFALPLGQLTSLPFSGKIVTHFGSRKILLFALPFYALSLVTLGLASAHWHLALGLYFFGISGSLCNIAVNTQGVLTEQLFKKPIMGSFHGSWSLAGFFGALVGLCMVFLNLTVFQHFVVVFVIIGVLIFFNCISV